MNRPIIVCLCGSTRFGEAFRIAEFNETIDGKIVLTIGCNMKSDEDLFGHMTDHMKAAIKKRLDLLHFQKIDLADEVLFLNVGGYIGQSTYNELEHARKRGKRIRWLEEVGAPNLRDSELPCDKFEPINTVYGNTYSGDCQTDGHYMCLKCVNHEPIQSIRERT